MDWTLVSKGVRNVAAFAAGVLVTKGIFTTEMASAWNADFTAIITTGPILLGAAVQLASLGGVIYHHWFPSKAAVQTAIANGPMLGRAGG